MARTKSTLYQLAVELGLDSAEFKKGAAQAVRQIDGLAKSTKGINSTMQSATKAFRQAATALAGFIGARALINASVNALEFADALGETATRIGITAEELQVLQFAASTTGSSVGQLDKAMTLFARKVGEAQAGVATTADAFKQLGIDVSGGVMPALEQFADTIAKAPTAAERLRIATEGFGKAGGQMVLMFQDGADGLKAFGEQADAAGIVIGEDLVDGAGRAADLLDVLKLRFHRLMQIPILEFLVAVADNFNALSFAARSTVATVRQAFDRLVVNIMQGRLNVMEFMLETHEFILDKFGAVIPNAERRLAATRADLAKVRQEYADLDDDLLRRRDADDAVLDKLAEGFIATDMSIKAAAASAGAFGTGIARAGEAAGGAADKVKKLDDELRSLTDLQSKATALAEAMRPAAETFAIARREIEDMVQRGLMPAVAQAEALARAQKELDDATGLTALRDQAEALRATLGGPVAELRTFALLLMQLRDEGLLSVAEQAELVNAKMRELGMVTEEAIEPTIAAVQSLAQEFSGDLTDALFDVQGSWLDFAQSFLESIAKMIVQAQLFKAITAAAGAFGFDLSGAANGAAFAGGQWLPFARGGIVDRPTAFAFAGGRGIMGEAGPEAIMPLTRRGGRLGVEGAAPIVNVYNNAGADVEVAPSGDGRAIDIVIERRLAAAIKSGALDRQMRATYGLRRRGE